MMPSRPLLLIALDGRLVAGPCLGRVVAVLPPGATLTQQVPALIEAHLELLQPAVLVLGQGTPGLGCRS